MGKTYPEHLFLHLYFFFTCFGDSLLASALCPYSALRSFPFHAKIVSPLMKVGCVSKWGEAEQYQCPCACVGAEGDQAHICLGKYQSSRETPTWGPKPPTTAPSAPRVCKPPARPCFLLLSFHSSTCRQRQWEFGQGAQDGVFGARN